MSVLESLANYCPEIVLYGEPPIACFVGEKVAALDKAVPMADFSIRSLLGIQQGKKKQEREGGREEDDKANAGKPGNIREKHKNEILVFHVPLDVSDEEMEVFLKTNHLPLVDYVWQPTPPHQRWKTACAEYPTEDDANEAILQLNHRAIRGRQVLVVKFVD